MAQVCNFAGLGTNTKSVHHGIKIFRKDKDAWAVGPGPSRAGLEITGPALVLDPKGRNEVKYLEGQEHPIQKCSADNPTIVAEDT